RPRTTVLRPATTVPPPPRRTTTAPPRTPLRPLTTVRLRWTPRGPLTVVLVTRRDAASVAMAPLFVRAVSGAGTAAEAVADTAAKIAAGANNARITLRILVLLPGCIRNELQP